MIYAVRGDGETSEKMILRYKKLFFQSRITNKIRNERYAYWKDKKKKIREKAIIRGKYRELNTKVYF